MSTATTKHRLTFCTVCSEPILDNNDCFSMGSNGWRHKRCKAGSAAWIAKYGESEISKSLSRRTKGSAKAPKVVDPIRQAVKEFCGREKYMRYMDTVNKTVIEWEIYSQELGVKQTKCEPPLDPEVLYAQLTSK